MHGAPGTGVTLPVLQFALRSAPMRQHAARVVLVDGTVTTSSASHAFPIRPIGLKTTVQPVLWLLDRAPCQARVDEPRGRLCTEREAREKAHRRKQV
ncbi:MAG: hypothetical protein KatS3mg060_3028 [Dehalococcoidia bacterium]|nr:MAG: hypothetical protein KatS3mg060_3028 [Dehalococcoidia bacterium]